MGGIYSALADLRAFALALWCRCISEWVESGLYLRHSVSKVWHLLAETLNSSLKKITGKPAFWLGQ